MVIDGLQYQFLNDIWAVTKNISNNNREIRIEKEIEGRPVVAIGDKVFTDHEDLEYIHIPESICSIGEYAFAGCTNLRRVKTIPFPSGYPSTVLCVSTRAFQDCRSLVVVDTLKKLSLSGGQNFQRCHKLETVGMHNELYGDIPQQAFQACTSLDFLVLNNDEQIFIKNNAFNWCSSLKSLYFKSERVICEDEDTWISLTGKKIYCRANCNLMDLGYDGTEVIVWEKP